MKTAVLFLHGSGGTGPELQNYLNSFRIPQFNSKSFLTIASDNNYDIFTPSSKICNYTPVGGERMNVWYDRSANFISLGRKDKEHQSSVTDSIKEISRIVRELENRYDKILIGGFSMGGGLALHFIRESVRPSSKLCGVFSMGSFLVENSLVFQETIQLSLPVFMMHGSTDSLIRPEWGQATAQQLHSRGMTALEFQLYPNLDHELGSSQLADLIVWLNRVVQSSHPSSSSSPLATTAVQCVSSSNDPLNSQITTGDTIPPYSIEKITTDSIAGNSDNHYRITFIVPKQYINQVCSRPIFCCGGQFELRPVATFTAIQSTSALSSVAVDGESALVPVTVDATTTDPVSVANEIVHRLCLRITGDTIDNPCPIQ